METTKCFVLGAGFTRAFLPDAPLLIDYYQVDELVKKFGVFPIVANILESEKSKYSDGRVNIENLFTRIQNAMPYDSEQEVFSTVLMELQDIFLRRLDKARRSTMHSQELAKFASYCVEKRVHCVTFNYDDALDQALWEVKKVAAMMPTEPYWHPDGGYGFFCRPSFCCLGDTSLGMDNTAMHLLKLHGSVNWFAKFGSTRPYVVDAIVHNEKWLPKYTPGIGELGDRMDDIARHIEDRPFIVPPVLVKSAIMEQTVLRLIWRLAYKTLQSCQQVVFIGYSMPVTDIAAHFLFSEALMKLPISNIKVVNFCKNGEEQSSLKQAYRKLFVKLRDDQFDFRDALDWVRELAPQAQNPQV